MATDSYALIRQAIRNKQIVVATYGGHRREMCPHALGYKNGREKALFYQFAGMSSSGLGPVGSADNWRCVFVDQLTGLSIRDANGVWYTADDHSRKQTCIDQVEEEVTY